MKMAFLIAAAALAYSAPSAAANVPLQTTVDATFTYGIGAYSALGGQLHGMEQIGVWDAPWVAGTVDVGVVLGFQDEPMALQYGAVSGQTNNAERLNAWVSVGHTFHFGTERRASLGVHFFNGWTQVWTQAALNNPAHGINTRVADSYGHFNTGAMLKFDYRFSSLLGATAQAIGPWPVGPSYVTTLFHVGLGIVFYL